MFLVLFKPASISHVAHVTRYPAARPVISPLSTCSLTCSSSYPSPSPSNYSPPTHIATQQLVCHLTSVNLLTHLHLFLPLCSSLQLISSPPRYPAARSALSLFQLCSRICTTSFVFVCSQPCAAKAQGHGCPFASSGTGSVCVCVLSSGWCEYISGWCYHISVWRGSGKENNIKRKTTQAAKHSLHQSKKRRHIGPKWLGSGLV